MRVYIYVCLAVLTAMISGCVVGPDGGYRRGGYSNGDYYGSDYRGGDYRRGDRDHNDRSDRGWNQQRRSNDNNNSYRGSSGGRNSGPYQPERQTN
jgi:hypothetical protein